MIHRLKINKEYLQNLINGRKKSEIRLNDRDYQLGDVLEFVEGFTNKKGWGDTRLHKFAITHIHSGLGLEPDYVVLSVERVE